MTRFLFEVVVQSQQGLIPLQIVVMNVVRLVVEHHQVTQALDAIKHRGLIVRQVLLGRDTQDGIYCVERLPFF